MLDVPDGNRVRQLLAIVADIARAHDIKREIASTDSLVDCGMTSMAMVDLMLAVETEFDVLIPQREMTPTNFQSVVTLALMLQRI